jgi:hypothetical protein
MPAAVAVNGGPIHDCGFVTQSYAHDNGFNQNTSGFSTLTPGASQNIIVYSGWISNLPPDQGGSGSLWDLLPVQTSGGAEAILQLVNGTDQGQTNCSSYGIEIEKTSGGTGHSSCIHVSAGGTYFFSFKVDFSSNSLASLALYTTNGATFTQVGSTVTVGLSTTGTISLAHIGNAEAGIATGTTTYFQNIMVDWTNHDFPNVPNDISPPTNLSVVVN